MAVTMEEFGIDRLTVDQRLELLGLIWDSVTAGGVPTPIPDWHRRELDRRIAAADADPGAARPWAEVRVRLLGGP
ncbi:addiction module protein [Urbifossiella limnaea]|uniref:Addiction module component n=1 Tax=Urbifossiella limnaea TaxID=2528023 RepID=A0A517XMV4_9BACT|nr:addiction module protein [Urbifossiella limnaea]QDU18822.1 Putative addiction module component [Urbifossiella limnaea]